MSARSRTSRCAAATSTGSGTPWETLPEVKELHFLTGDWDILVCLDFPPPATKRRVLDFVTERIRGIPEVLDTSTVVPEFSVTKFPIA